MKLSYRLFLSYIFVVLVTLAVVLVATWFVAPANFIERMTGMQGYGYGSGSGGGMMSQRMQALDSELDSNFRQAVDSALLIAAIIAIIAALIVSWLMSQRIVNPIRALVALSQRIAGGHYEQRLHLNTHDELAELVDSFNRMAISLANTETMRVRLLGDVTHELKTPLTSIKGYMEGLQDGVLPATPETFQLVHREADRLQRLVQDLQELSRTEAGQIPLELVPCDPKEIMQTVINRMQPQFTDKNITLTAELPDTLPPVYIDCDRTSQVLTNLLGNALQYTPPDGQVTVSARKEQDTVRITVADNGMGLSQEDLARIFQRFYRVDKSRSRKSGGSGIGLTIAKHLVEAQGGRIQAESDGPGKGSMFSFTLPIA